MTDKFLRIASLYERNDCLKIAGQWHCPVSALDEILAEHGLRVVPAEPVPGSHGAQREAATACELAHETAPGNAKHPAAWSTPGADLDIEGGLD